MELSWGAVARTLTKSPERQYRRPFVLSHDRTGWIIPGIPRSIQWGVLFFLPLAGAGAVLYFKLATLPAEAWSWTLYPGAFLGALLLMPINWGLESLKWAELLPWARMERRVREVLYGTAWSLIGPFRLGAGIGRVAAVRTPERNMAMRAFATACVSQWWCTVTAAGIALLSVGFWLAGGAVMVLSAVAIGLYFGWTPRFWRHLKSSPLCGHWGMSRRIATIRRRRALVLSIARFVVMLSQFVLLLNAFGHLCSIDHPLDRMLSQMEGASLTWGMTSLAPMPAFGDLGLREAAALWSLPAPDASDVTAILAATLTLWLLNILIPAIVGLVWQWNATRKVEPFRAKFGA